MVFVWNPGAIPNLVSGLVTLAAGAFVLVTGAGRRANRLLAAIFCANGLATFAVGIQYSLDDATSVYALQATLTPVYLLGSALYPAFLGAALTRGAPPALRSRAWLAGSLTAWAIVAAWMIARPDLVVAGVQAMPYARYDAVPGPLFVLALIVGAVVVSLLGLVLSFRELRRSPRGTPARRRATYFLVAFGVQDVSIASQATAIALTTPGSALFNLASVAGFALGLTATSVLVAYGILRYQLFDIDVKIKLGVKRTTLAGVFLAVIFVVAQLVQTFAGIFLGAIAGAVAAGLLLVAIHPLQRIAERVSDAAMPRVRDTEEYRTVRKREVYLAAVESAMDDGEITDKERNVLATLADQLGLGVKETLEIERAAKSERRVA